MHHKLLVGLALLGMVAGCHVQGSVEAADRAEGKPTDQTSSPDGVSPGNAPTTPGQPPGVTPGAPGATASDGGTPTTEEVVIREPVNSIASATTRRLSHVELSRTYTSLFGFVPDALSQMPPDSGGYGFDRVVNSQTLAQSHVEAFANAAREAATKSLSDGSLTAAVAACSADILPPAVPSSVEQVIGAAMALSPDWAVQLGDGNSTSAVLFYAPNCSAGYTNNFEAPGRYELTLQASVRDTPIQSVDVILGENIVETLSGFSGAATLTAALEITEPGSQTVTFEFHGGDNTQLSVDSLEIKGPIDPGAETQGDARKACADGVIAQLAPRAFRRPLESAEVTTLNKLYDASVERDGHAIALRVLMEAVLNSPHFLYLIEVGTPLTEGSKTNQLNSFEVAARLSYALCESPPDEALRTAAEADSLRSPDAVFAEASRLLQSECGKRGLSRFFTQWLEVDRLETLTKSPDIEPAFTPELRQGMLDEFNRYVDELVWNEDATLEQFIASDHFWPTPATASLYGLELSEQSERQFPNGRRGVLSLPGVLAVHSAFDESNPILRAKFVLQRLLCSLPPPPTFVVKPPPVDPTLTTRERWRQHSDVAGCAECHAIMDPVGFAFENFDAIGQYRTTENGHNVDNSGGIPSIGVPDGELHGAAELAIALSTSDEAAACFATHWFRYSMSRLEVPNSQDADTIDQLSQQVASQSMVDAMLSIFRTEQFLLLSGE